MKNMASYLKRKPLKKMGKDKARETAKYWPLRRKFLEDHPFCEFPNGGHQSCINRAISIHHIRGQHWKIMNDTRWWMGLCAEHHAWIHANAKDAKARGLIIDSLKEDLATMRANFAEHLYNHSEPI